MIPLFVLTAVSGIGLHIAGHGAEHEVWHNWAVAHVAASLLFTVAAVMHIATHRGWYKSFVRSGIGNKSRVTVVLSVLFSAVVGTGIALLGWIDGANSQTGLWHYATGLALAVVATGHIIKRRSALKKSIKKRNYLLGACKIKNVITSRSNREWS